MSVLGAGQTAEDTHRNADRSTTRTTERAGILTAVRAGTSLFEGEFPEVADQILSRCCTLGQGLWRLGVGPTRHTSLALASFSVTITSTFFAFCCMQQSCRLFVYSLQRRFDFASMPRCFKPIDSSVNGSPLCYTSESWTSVMVMMTRAAMNPTLSPPVFSTNHHTSNNLTKRHCRTHRFALFSHTSECFSSAPAEAMRGTLPIMCIHAHAKATLTEESIRDEH